MRGRGICGRKIVWCHRDSVETKVKTTMKVKKKRKELCRKGVQREEEEQNRRKREEEEAKKRTTEGDPLLHS